MPNEIASRNFHSLINTLDAQSGASLLQQDVDPTNGITTLFVRATRITPIHAALHVRNHFPYLLALGFVSLRNSPQRSLFANRRMHYAPHVEYMLCQNHQFTTEFPITIDSFQRYILPNLRSGSMNSNPLPAILANPGVQQELRVHGLFQSDVQLRDIINKPNVQQAALPPANGQALSQARLAEIDSLGWRHSLPQANLPSSSGQHQQQAGPSGLSRPQSSQAGRPMRTQNQQQPVLPTGSVYNNNPTDQDWDDILDTFRSHARTPSPRR